jgi:hypothetical protein
MNKIDFGSNTMNTHPSYLTPLGVNMGCSPADRSAVVSLWISIINIPTRPLFYE